MWISDIEEFIKEMDVILKEEEEVRLKEYEKMKKKQKLKEHNYVKELVDVGVLTKEQKAKWVTKMNNRNKAIKGDKKDDKKDNKKE